MPFKLGNPLGAWGEQFALRYYLNHGYLRVAVNIFNPRGKRYGEIDLIMRKGRVLAFVEVKTRRTETFGHPAEAVTYQKQLRLLKTVQWFLNAHPDLAILQPRIDVCIVQAMVDKTQKNVIIIPNAVELPIG